MQLDVTCRAVHLALEHLRRVHEVRDSTAHAAIDLVQAERRHRLGQTPVHEERAVDLDHGGPLQQPSAVLAVAGEGSLAGEEPGGVAVVERLPRRPVRRARRGGSKSFPSRVEVLVPFVETSVDQVAADHEVVLAAGPGQLAVDQADATQ